MSYKRICVSSASNRFKYRDIHLYKSINLKKISMSFPKFRSSNESIINMMTHEQLKEKIIDLISENLMYTGILDFA